MKSVIVDPSALETCLEFTVKFLLWLEWLDTIVKSVHFGSHAKITIVGWILATGMCGNHG